MPRGRPQIYFTDEDRKEAHRLASARYREKNLDKVRQTNRLFMRSYDNAENAKRYWEDNKEKIRERSRARRINTTPTLETIEYSTILMNDCCSYCGSREGIEIDHIVPLNSGGEHAVDNLTAACKSCNSGKCARSLLEYMNI
jgi:5-methylcytosine-specific restriction endonuclease McrA